MQTETAHLLDYLERSGCAFYRNGNWYPSADARAHVERKYRYLLRKDLIRTTEDFIKLAASESSTSGKSYEVRCAGQGARPSGPWLTEELQRYRQHPAVDLPNRRTTP